MKCKQALSIKGNFIMDQKRENQIIDALMREQLLENEQTAKDSLIKNNQIIRQGLGTNQSALLELLQNANDCGVSEGKFVSICCTITPGFLIFQHNGKAFTEEDVKKLNRFFASDDASEKRQNMNLSGYKGIGFKSIYNETDFVSIISGGFSYQYRKSFWENAENGRYKNYPWQSMPILKNREEIEKQLNVELKANVNFVFEMPEAKSRTLFEKIFTQTDWLVFFEKLQHIYVFNQPQNQSKHIAIFRDTKQNWEHIRIKLEEGNPQKTLKSIATQEWVILTSSENIPHELHMRIAENPNIPPKFKKPIPVNISFAVKIQGQKIIPHDNSVLFCHRMPLRLTLKLPVLLNADFLPDMARSNLLSSTPEKDWNQFILEASMKSYGRMLVTMASSDFFDKKTLLNALAIPDWTQLPEEKEKIEKIFTATFKNTAFLPSLFNPRKLLAISESKYDETSLIHDLLKNEAKKDRFMFTQEYFLFKTENFILNQMENIQVIKQFDKENGGKFEIVSWVTIPGKICELARLYQNNFDFQVNLHQTLKYWCDNARETMSMPHKERLLLDLYNSSFLVPEKPSGTNLLLKKPSEIFFFSEKTLLPMSMIRELIAPLNLKFLNPILLQDPNIHSWFKVDLKIQETNESSLLDGLIFLIETHDPKIETATFTVAAFLFCVFSNKKLPRDSLEKLQNLRLKTKNGTYQKASLLFLANDYEPEKKLETILSEDDSCLSIDYIIEIQRRFPEKYNNEQFLREVREFFLSIGVVEKISLVTRKPYSVKKAKQNGEFYIESYISDAKKICNSAENRDFETFTSVTFISYFYTKPQLYAPLFWEVIKSNWKDVKQQMSLKTPSKNIKDSHISYLIFILKEKKLHLAKQTNPPYFSNERYYSHQLYWAALDEVFFLSSSIRVAAYLEDFTVAMAEELGFKTKIDIKDIVLILAELNKIENDVPILKYQSVLKQLLAQKCTEEEREQLKIWKNNGGLLPCEANQLQEIKKLKVFAIPNVNAPSDSLEYLKEFPGISPEEMKKIGELFGIEIYKEPKYQFAGAKRDTILEESLEAHLPAFALLSAQGTGEKASNLLADIWDKFQTIECYEVQTLEPSGIKGIFIGSRFYRLSSTRLNGNLAEYFLEKIQVLLGLNEKVRFQKLKEIFFPHKAASKIERDIRSKNPDKKFLTGYTEMTAILSELKEAKKNTCLMEADIGQSSSSSSATVNNNQDEMLIDCSENNSDPQKKLGADLNTILNDETDEESSDNSLALERQFSELSLFKPPTQTNENRFFLENQMSAEILSDKSFGVDEDEAAHTTTSIHLNKHEKTPSEKRFSEDSFFDDEEDEKDGNGDDEGDDDKVQAPVFTSSKESEKSTPFVHPAQETRQTFPRAGKSPSNPAYQQLKEKYEEREKLPKQKTTASSFSLALKAPRSMPNYRPPNLSYDPNNSPYRVPSSRETDPYPYRKQHVTDQKKTKESNNSQLSSSADTKNPSSNDRNNTSTQSYTSRNLFGASSSHSGSPSMQERPSTSLPSSSSSSSFFSAAPVPSNTSFSPNLKNVSNARLAFTEPKKNHRTVPLDFEKVNADKKRKQIIALLSDEGESVKIGYMGERFVYDYLKKKYLIETTNSTSQMISTKNGFEIKDSRNQTKLIEVIWFNAERSGGIGEPIQGHSEYSEYSMIRKESGKPADLKIIFYNQNELDGKPKKLYIEVKATKGSTPQVANFTKNEWNRMFKYGNRNAYAIYRVYGINTQNPTLCIFDAPAQDIQRRLPNTGEKGKDGFYVESIQFKL